MKLSEIGDYAHRLYAAHGDRAEYEAAQKVLEAERRKDPGQADDWRRIREAIRGLRGPNQG